MIKTRDFILYLVCLVFVILAAFYTGLSDLRATALELTHFFTSTNGEAPSPTAQKPMTAFDRDTRIAQLREKIADGEGARDDVSASVPTPEVPVSPDADTFVPVTSREVEYCNTAAVSPLLALWPSKVTVQEVEGVRIGYANEVTEVVIGTSTQQESIQKVIFELPVRVSVASYTTCLPDTLVGVTTSGQPLLNTGANVYAAVGPDTRIGYSRDGFAIYGVDSSVALDECGGTVVDGVYRYHLRADESFIVACYSHIPTPINF